MSRWDNRFMRLAREVSSWSKDPSTKVGAVLVRDRRIVATGYNGFPRGMVDDDRLQVRDIKYKRVIHAEMNAVLFAGPDGARGATVYIYGMRGPCNNCSKHLIQAGIRRVVCCGPEPRPDWSVELEDSKFMLAECMVEYHEIEEEDL